LQEASRKTESPYDRDTEAIPRLIMLLFVSAFAIGAAVGYFTQGFGFFSGSMRSQSTPTSSQPAAPTPRAPETRPLPVPQPIATPAPARPAPARPRVRERVSPPAPAPATPRTRVDSPPRLAPTQPVAVSGPVFRVQVGAFRSRENAESLVDKLQRDGFRPYINFVAGMHRVRIGPFTNRADADNAAEALRAKDYNVFVTR
jgi:DedD protein